MLIVALRLVSEMPFDAIDQNVRKENRNFIQLSFFQGPGLSNG